MHHEIQLLTQPHTPGRTNQPYVSLYSLVSWQWKTRIPHKSLPNTQMRAALDDGGLMLDEIAVISAHGIGTPVGDTVEAESVCQLFGRSALKNTFAFGGVNACLAIGRLGVDS